MMMLVPVLTPHGLLTLVQSLDAVDEVVLFSGGLDSLSGAIEELATNGKRVALVSHRSSPKMYDHQKHLVTDLVARFPQAEGKVMHVPVLATTAFTIRSLANGQLKRHDRRPPTR